MSDQHHDDEARTAARLAELYHGGEAEQPPPELDRRILAAAQVASGRRRPRWPLAGFATAAVAVLAVAILLRTALDTTFLGSAPESVAPAVRAPEPEPSMPARSLDQVEEVVVTGALVADREERRAASRQRRSEATERPARETAADSAGRATPRYAASDCPEPFPLPPAATIRSVADGIEVTADGASFVLRCSDGEWQREPAPQAER